MNFDPAHPEASIVDAAIDVHSVLTRDERRDGHLKTPDFFDAEKHPLITLEGGGFLLSDEVDVEIDLQMIRPSA